MMKKTSLYILLFVCLFVSTGLASYTYVVDIYQLIPTLYGTESLLVIENGGTGTFGMWGSSFASIQGTSPLVDGVGGIWHIDLLNSSALEMSGGQVHQLTMNNDATVFLSGGLIQQIYSSQNAWKWDNQVDPAVQVPNPHITIECLDHFYNADTNLLTGHWLDDGAAFSIHLVDVQGSSPAIENIQFVPEPATLLLLSLGGLLIRRKK